MKVSRMRNAVLAALLWACACLPGAAAPAAAEKGFGRVTGTVLDTGGNPLMGATVLVIGPLVLGAEKTQGNVERLFTDYQGAFVIEHLMPGWYSLRVTAAARLPALRTGVHVQAGETAQEKFVLADLLSSLRVQSPKVSSSSWGEDWKWILRASASTRPILRYQDEDGSVRAEVKKPALPASQRLIGITPGTSRSQTLGGDGGQGSILAYLRPLSEDSDVLVAGSMAADGLSASSVVTAFRKNLASGDPQEVSLAMHQLSFTDGIPLPSGDSQDSLRHAQIFVATYDSSRRLSSTLTLTTGIEVDYLNAGITASSARPHASIRYRFAPSDSVEVKYGTYNPASAGDLVERIGLLTTFPQITMDGYRPQFEELNHGEANFIHRFRKNSELQVAAYRDSFHNTAIWGFGEAGAFRWLAADALPNPAANGWTLNAGSYTSLGVRVSLAHSIGSYLDTLFMYASGQALEVAPESSASGASGGSLRDSLRSSPSPALAGKVSARLPRCRTQVTTSYEWIGRGRVTGVDPFGEAEFELQPFLDVQVRQPLPTVAFIPGHIEAIADFRNLLQQGYVAVIRSGDQLVLAPAYRSFRGGFSVQF